MILNLENLKVYVGSSSNISKRRQEHFNSLAKNTHYNSHLQKSYNKYGKEKFSFLILERNIPREDLHIREIFHIEQKDSLNKDKGYNIGIPLKNVSLIMRPEHIESRRRRAYEYFYGEITDEAAYQNWRENKLNPPRMTKEEIRREAIQRQGKPLYGICQTTNKILEEFDCVQDVVNKYSRKRVSKYINHPTKFFRKMALVSKDSYNEDNDYTKKYKITVWEKKGTFKGRRIETYDIKTSKTIKQYANPIELAEDLGLTVKYVGDIKRKSKAKGIYQNMGFRNY